MLIYFENSWIFFSFLILTKQKEKGYVIDDNRHSSICIESFRVPNYWTFHGAKFHVVLSDVSGQNIHRNYYWKDKYSENCWADFTAAMLSYVVLSSMIGFIHKIWLTTWGILEVLE